MNVHLMGVGGVGVGALAQILAARGEQVSGCDLRETETFQLLQRLGIRVTLGHDPAHVAGQDLVAHSAAVKPQEPELVAAGGRAILWRHLLARLLAAGEGVAVTGTSGKTTTTHMLGSILTSAGWDPSVLVGDGRSSRFGRSRWFVAEVDESDRSLTLHHPRAALVLNVDFDHPDHFRDLADTRALFAEFLSGLPAVRCVLGRV